MLVEGKHYRTIWLNEETGKAVQIIDQRHLPHRFVIENLESVDEVIVAIKDMHVRGAGLIGAAAGYGIYLAVLEASNHSDSMDFINSKAIALTASRPTAVNLKWAVDRQLDELVKVSNHDDRIDAARRVAQEIADEDAAFCRSIGLHGVKIIEEISRKKKGGTVNILTHCNAGWLAFTDYGSATSPIYEAFDRGLDVHVWVDETRPRNQGASLTAWELLNHGVPHTIIADNSGGHLMQHGQVDMVITGADRVTRSGDVANKIGTYLKALAAADNNIPFYVAIPSSTIDWNISDGIKEIPIEIRGAEEVRYVQGKEGNEIKSVLITPEESPAVNYGFDVTPASLVSGFITERGICEATESDILTLYPEHSNQ